MALVDLDNLSPEAIEQLKSVLGSSGGTGRSPIRKPLTDLRQPQSVKGRLNRPHFEFSAEDDGHTVIPPFPRLYWDDKGVERKVFNEAELRGIPETWTSAPPLRSVAVDPMIAIQAEFDSLSADDQAFVLNAQKQARLARLHGLLANVSEQDIAGLTPKPIADKIVKEKKTA